MIKRWRLKLNDAGFQQSSEDEHVIARTQGFVKQSVWEGRSKFVKNKIQINLAVSIHDRFLEPPDYIVVLVAHLRANGIALMNRGEGRWWDETEAATAMTALFDYGIPWLEEHSDALWLTNFLEHGVQEETTKPASQPGGLISRLAERLLLRQDGAAGRPTLPAPIHNLYLSLLYNEMGDPLSGCKYAQAYLNHVRACDLPNEPKRTLRQLASMNCHEASRHEGEVVGPNDIEGDFNCCGNAEPFPFKCSDCGHIMAYCVESNDLFPNLHNLEEVSEGVNSLGRTLPAFTCPRCGHSFEYYFLKKEAYRVTREEMIEHGLGYLLLKRS